MFSRSERYSADETAAVTLELDETISALRRGITDSTGDIIEKRSGLPLRALMVSCHVNDRPSGDELAILTALSSVYGNALLEDETFQPVIRLIAQEGAISVLQRILFSDDLADIKIALLLVDAHAPLHELCELWPHIFLGNAHAALSRFSAR